jgi:Tfp pilus assembly ATPase PilU
LLGLTYPVAVTGLGQALLRLAGLRRAPPGRNTAKIALFAAKRSKRLSTISRYFNRLGGKFVIRRINENFPPINEFKLPYQPKNNGIHAGRENGKCGLISGLDTTGEGRPGGGD